MKTIKILLSLILTCSMTALYAQTPPNIMSSYANSSNTFTIKPIANTSNQVVRPRDLDFHPTTGDLWVVNQGTANTGGSTVTIKNPGQTNQTSQYIKDPNSWHFMSLPSGIAFGTNTNFGTSTSIYDANHNGGAPFTGPALWPSAQGVYGVQPPGLNGSHLDMLHGSPYCMGIAWQKDNIYWVTDMNNNDVVMYDFAQDHGPGNANHDDGIIRRYTGQSISWINQSTSSHLAFDDNKKWLYIVDGGGKRVIRLDITTGSQGGTPSFPQYEQLAEYRNYDNATWETVIDTGLVKPVGIAVVGNFMAVSDNDNGDIVIYNISNIPAQEVNRVKTTAGIQGIDIGPDGRIWFVNTTANTVGTIEPAVVTKVDNFITNSNLLSVFPNPTKGEFQLQLDGLNSDANLTIANMNGQQVFEKDIATDNEKINVSKLSAGIYFLKVRNERFNITKKLIIQ